MPITRPSSPQDKVTVLSAFKVWVYKVITDISEDSESKDTPKHVGSQRITSTTRRRISAASNSDFADTLDDISVQFDNDNESSNDDDAFERDESFHPNRMCQKLPIADMELMSNRNCSESSTWSVYSKSCSEVRTVADSCVSPESEYSVFSFENVCSEKGEPFPSIQAIRFWDCGEVHAQIYFGKSFATVVKVLLVLYSQPCHSRPVISA